MSGAQVRHDGEAAAHPMLGVVVAEILRLCHPIHPVLASTAVEDIPDLDSIRIVELVQAVEKLAGREVDYERLDRVVSVGDLAAVFGPVGLA